MVVRPLYSPCRGAGRGRQFVLGRSMKLATTTADFRSYSDRPAEHVKMFAGTGFKWLDLNLYRSVFPESPFLGDGWKKWIDDAGEAASELGIGFCQAHAPNGNLHALGEEFDIFLGATIRAVEACGRLGIPHIVTHQQDIGGYPSREKQQLNLRRNRDFFARLFPVMERTGVRANSTAEHTPSMSCRVCLAAATCRCRYL